MGKDQEMTADWFELEYLSKTEHYALETFCLFGFLNL